MQSGEAPSLASSDSLSSSYSLSISSGSSSSSAGQPTDAAVLKPAETPWTGKPFVPPKITPRKKIPPKRPLPKRVPLPGKTPLIEAKTVDHQKREEQIAALQSQLMTSRATIGQRWKESWNKVDSSKSALSEGSDFDDLDEVNSSGLSSEMSRSGDRTLYRESTRGSSLSSLGTEDAPRSLRSISTDILALLKREAESDFETSDEESDSAVNLTASSFVDDLTLDVAAHESEADVLPPSSPREPIMPRPLQKLKIRLFSESGPDSGSSPSSSESSISEEWRRLRSRETSVPKEHESLQEAESRGEEELEPEEQTEEGSDVVEANEEVEIFSTASSQAEEPDLRWEIEEAEERHEVPAPVPTTKIVQRPLRASDMNVESRLEEDACQEDFDRREMADRIIYEYVGVPLTSKLNKLRDERVRLAAWANRLRGREITDEDKPVVYRGPLIRPAGKDAGSPFGRGTPDLPQSSDFLPGGRGPGGGFLLKGPLTSTRVLHMEQRSKRLQRQLAQKREHLLVLKAAICKQINPNGEQDESTAGQSSGLDPEELSPRTAELKLYEEQCAYLAAQLDEEQEFSDAYRKQLNRALYKNKALRKRHENAVDFIRQNKIIQEQQRAKQIEAEEQLVDLKDQVKQEATKRGIETSSRQQREEQALTLQERYVQLIHYLQEAEEKRSAYEDGLRTAQSHAQKATALLQTKEVEIAYAKHHMESQDVQMLEKEVLRRKERDRANLAEKQIQKLNESLAAKDSEILDLRSKISDGEAQLQEKDNETEQTMKTLQRTQTVLQQREADVEALQLQIKAHQKTEALMQRKLAVLEDLTADFEALAKETMTDEADLKSWRDALEERRAKAVKMLEKAEHSALTVLSKLDQKGADAHAMNELSRKIDALRLAREAELIAHGEEHKKLTEERQTVAAQLQKKEKEAKMLHREIEALKVELKRESTRRKCATSRVIKSARAYGRKHGYSLSKELQMMQIGTPIEMLSNSSSHRPNLLYLKLFKNGIVMWTSDLTGSKGYSNKDSFSAKDIVGIDFGFSSLAYIWAVETKTKKSPQQPPSPWRCFTVRTLKATYNFRANSDHVAQDWVIGLGRLSSVPSAPMIKSKRELVVHRVRMKLDAYANHRGVRPAIIWKEAINRTLAQMPHIRQRAADRSHQESTRQQQNETGSRKRNSHGPSLREESDVQHTNSKHGVHAPHSADLAARGTQKATENRLKSGSLSPEGHNGKSPGSPAENRHASSPSSETERHPRGTKPREGRKKSEHALPTNESKEDVISDSGERRKDELVQPPASGAKPHNSRDQPEGDKKVDKSAEKKISRKILSRASSIFKNTTKSQE